MAGMSCTSNVSEPGDSTKTTRVLGSHQGADAGTDERVVEGGLDAEALELGAAEAARWPVHAVGHQDVVTGFDVGEDRDDAGSQAGRVNLALVAAFEFGQGFFEQVAVGGAVQAVVGAGLFGCAVFLLLLPLGHRFAEDGGGTEHRCVDSAGEALGVAAEVNGFGVVMHGGVMVRRGVVDQEWLPPRVSGGCLEADGGLQSAAGEQNVRGVRVRQSIILLYASPH